jgi:hypothetical protein
VILWIDLGAGFVLDMRVSHPSAFSGLMLLGAATHPFSSGHGPTWRNGGVNLPLLVGGRLGIEAHFDKFCIRISSEQSNFVLSACI